MSEKDSSVPPFVVIRACARGIVRAFAEWFRSLVLRSIQLARRLAAKRRIYIDIRELQQFDDRMLADIGITMDRGAKFGGQIVALTGFACASGRSDRKSTCRWARRSTSGGPFMMQSDRKSQLITMCMLIGALAMIGLALTGTLEMRVSRSPIAATK